DADPHWLQCYEPSRRHWELPRSSSLVSCPQSRPALWTAPTQQALPGSRQQAPASSLGSSFVVSSTCGLLKKFGAGPLRRRAQFPARVLFRSEGSSAQGAETRLDVPMLALPRQWEVTKARNRTLCLAREIKRVSMREYRRANSQSSSLVCVQPNPPRLNLKEKNVHRRSKNPRQGGRRRQRMHGLSPRKVRAARRTLRRGRRPRRRRADVLLAQPQHARALPLQPGVESPARHP